MPQNEFNRTQGKLGEKNVALAQMITPEIITDLFRAQGAILTLERLGIVESGVVTKFEECFEEVRGSLIKTKGLVVASR